MGKIFILTLFFAMAGHSWAAAGEEAFTLKRQQMVREQIEARGVTDRRVLEVMRRVRRHLFVPDP